MNTRWSRMRQAALAGLVAVSTTAMVVADGTETLGPPADLAVASGTGIVAGGTGLESQPGEIEIEVPAGATVNQVILYWGGEFRVADDDTITIEGQEVTGDLIGGPTFFYNWQGDVFVSAYRADITDLGLVVAGANTLTVEGLDYDEVNDGAGVLVIYDDGSTAATIDLRDGADLAFFNFPEPRQTCVPQTFTFPAEDEERVATLVIYAGSVEEGRPNGLLLTIDDVTEQLDDVFGSFSGPDWDTVTLDVTIPAGATELTVEPISVASTNPLGASLLWVGAGLSVPSLPPPPPPPPGGGEGCTPGFWKQPHHYQYWVGYSPLNSFNTVFGVNASPSRTLLGWLTAGGGQWTALNRQAVAALLSAANPDVNYAYTPAEVISMVKAAYASGKWEATKNLLEAENEAGCPDLKKIKECKKKVNFWNKKPHERPSFKVCKRPSLKFLKKCGHRW